MPVYGWALLALARRSQCGSLYEIRFGAWIQCIESAHNNRTRRPSKSIIVWIGNCVAASCGTFGICCKVKRHYLRGWVLWLTKIRLPLSSFLNWLRKASNWTLLFAKRSARSIPFEKIADDYAKRLMPEVLTALVAKDWDYDTKWALWAPLRNGDYARLLPKED